MRPKLNSIRKVLEGKGRNFWPTKISSFTVHWLSSDVHSFVTKLNLSPLVFIVKVVEPLVCQLGLSLKRVDNLAELLKDRKVIGDQFFTDLMTRDISDEEVIECPSFDRVPFLSKREKKIRKLLQELIRTGDAFTYRIFKDSLEKLEPLVFRTVQKVEIDHLSKARGGPSRATW